MTTRTLTLADFLLARIAEDEAVAQCSGIETRCRRPGEDEWSEWFDEMSERPGIYEVQHRVAADPRALRECAAKRRIVERSRWVEEHPEWANNDDVAGHWEDCSATLYDLASIYADHEDYDPAWA